MNRTLAEQLLGIVRDTYAWRIDVWPEVDGGGPIEPPGTVVCGPSDAPTELLQLLERGEGRRFRLLDGGRQVYCEGRILAFGSKGEEVGYDADFGPLHDYGEGMGCTSIEYWDDKEWVEL